MADKKTKKPIESNKESILERTPDNTLELKVKIPWELIKKQRELVIDQMSKSVNLPGFRQGKAPKKLVEEKLDPLKVREETLRQLLPTAYSKAVNEHGLRPIMDPRIHLEEALEDDKDWEFHAVTCELPTVESNSYKADVKKITAKSKIIVPGKEAVETKFEDIAKILLENSTVIVPNILAEKEADRLLSQTLDDIKKLGMGLDEYLSSTGKKAEDLRAEYIKKAQDDIKLEFIFAKIAETEKITVEDEEVQKTIDNAKPEEKESLTQNKYLLASIIRQQKTLDFLRSL